MLNFKVYWSILGTYFILVRASTCLVFWIESSKSFEKSLVATLSVWFQRYWQPDSKSWYGGNLFCIKLLSRVTHISRICWGLMPDSLQPQCVRYNGSTVQREDKQMLPTILRGGTGDCSAWRRSRSGAAAEARNIRKTNQLSAEARNIEKTNQHSKIPLSQWVQMQASYPSMNSVLPVSSWCFLANFVNVTNIYQSNCKKPSRCQLLSFVLFFVSNRFFQLWIPLHEKWTES